MVPHTTPKRTGKGHLHTNIVPAQLFRNALFNFNLPATLMNSSLFSKNFYNEVSHIGASSGLLNQHSFLTCTETSHISLFILKMKQQKKPNGQGSENVYNKKDNKWVLLPIPNEIFAYT